MPSPVQSAKPQGGDGQQKTGTKGWLPGCGISKACALKSTGRIYYKAKCLDKAGVREDRAGSCGSANKIVPWPRGRENNLWERNEDMDLFGALERSLVLPSGWRPCTQAWGSKDWAN